MIQLESSAIRGDRDKGGSNSDTSMDQVDIFLKQTEILGLEKPTSIITDCAIDADNANNVIGGNPQTTFRKWGCKTCRQAFYMWDHLAVHDLFICFRIDVNGIVRPSCLITTLEKEMVDIAVR